MNNKYSTMKKYESHVAPLHENLMDYTTSGRNYFSSLQSQLYGKCNHKVIVVIASRDSRQDLRFRQTETQTFDMREGVWQKSAFNRN